MQSFHFEDTKKKGRINVSAVIPAYNEERLIASTIKALESIQAIEEIVVVDDGSADDTARKAKNAGKLVRVISQDRNQGKYAALDSGVKAANGDVLCFVDADLGSSAAKLDLLLPPVLTEKVDMTVAVFPKVKRRAGFGFVKKVAEKGIYVLTGHKSRAPLSGQRVLRRKVWEKMTGMSHGFGVEVELTITCLRHGFSLREIEVFMQHRESGRNLQGFLHRGKQFTHVSLALLRLWGKERANE